MTGPEPSSPAESAGDGTRAPRGDRSPVPKGVRGDPVRWHEQAVTHNARGRPAAGASAATRALALLGVDPDAEPPRAADDVERLTTVARVLATLAKSEVEVRSIDAGLVRMAQASRWAEAVGADDLLGFVHSQHALLLFRGGRFAAALEEFAAAAEHLDLAAGVDRCRLLINRGALHVEMGSLDLARADLTAAVEVARGLGEERLERIALHNLGCLEFFAGDLPLALRIIDEGIVMDEDTQIGIALLDRVSGAPGRRPALRGGRGPGPRPRGSSAGTGPGRTSARSS